MNEPLLTGRMASTMRIVALSMRADEIHSPWIMKAASSMIRNDKDGLMRALAQFRDITVEDDSPIMGVMLPAIMQDMQMFSRGNENIFRMRPPINPKDPEFITSLIAFSNWNRASVEIGDPEEELQEDRSLEIS